MRILQRATECRDDWTHSVPIPNPASFPTALSDSLRLEMDAGGCSSFVGLAIELLIAGAKADGACFSVNLGGLQEKFFHDHWEVL
jgi:hypothetical protein